MLGQGHHRQGGRGWPRSATSAMALSSCPQGHELQPWTAFAGTCDGCERRVREGEQVMDCRRCNWYVCEVCLPRDQAQDASIWGTIAALPFYAMDVAAHDFG